MCAIVVIATRVVGFVFPVALCPLQMQEQTRQAAARGDAAVTPLADLELISFVDKEGKVTPMDTTGVKASVYAVYDEVNGATAQVIEGSTHV